MTDLAALTVDFELFEHTPAYRSATGSTERSGTGLDGGAFLRRLLDSHDATATWFVVSAVAESTPDAVTAIADAGHEIGSHTHSHRLLSDLDRDQRREELAHSRDVLRSLTGESVAGLRAPAFDVTDDHFELLAEAGYDYDASVVPSRNIPGWYGGTHDLHRPAPATAVDPAAPADLAEVPTSVMPGLELPLTGTWLRFFGPRYTLLGMKLLARRGIAPILYVHPWEFVDLPAVEGVPRRVYFRTGNWMRRAVDRILAADFAFTTVSEVLTQSGLAGARSEASGPADGPGRGGHTVP